MLNCLRGVVRVIAEAKGRNSELLCSDEVGVAATPLDFACVALATIFANGSLNGDASRSDVDPGYIVLISSFNVGPGGIDTGRGSNGRGWGTAWRVWETCRT